MCNNILLIIFLKYGNYINCVYVIYVICLILFNMTTIKFVGEIKINKNKKYKNNDNIFNDLYFKSIEISDLINIDEYMFSCVLIDSITLKSVETIGRCAFYKCCLKFVNLPNTLTTIKYGAFMGCYNLTTINLPNSLKYIGKYAFSNDVMRLISIPIHISYIKNNTLKNCTIILY